MSETPSQYHLSDAEWNYKTADNVMRAQTSQARIEKSNQKAGLVARAGKLAGRLVTRNTLPPLVVGEIGNGGHDRYPEGHFAHGLSGFEGKGDNLYRQPALDTLTSASQSEKFYDPHALPITEQLHTEALAEDAARFTPSGSPEQAQLQQAEATSQKMAEEIAWRQQTGDSNVRF